MSDCPVCDDESPLLDATGAPLSRRRFLRSATALATAAFVPMNIDALADAADTKNATETLSAELFTRLKRGDKRMLGYMTHPTDSKLMKVGHPGWHISRVFISNLPPRERALAIQCLQSVTTRDCYRRIRKQMREDEGGIQNYSVGFFGAPGDPKFQFIICGRHFTMRMDGGRDDGVAWGGPVVYGHDEANHRAEYNLWFHHMTWMTRVFDSLDSLQRAKLMVDSMLPHEHTVKIRPTQHWQGIKVAELTDDQRALLIKTVKRVFGEMYGDKSVAEIDSIVKANGGWGMQHLACYERANKHNDKIWDVWRLEGPGFLWYFRGDPHVHAFVNIYRV